MLTILNRLINPKNQSYNMAKKTHEEWDVYNNVFDTFTDQVLKKLQGQGYFDELLHLIALGKEGNVFLAKRGDGFVCVKIYRLQTCDFNKMLDYLKLDPKFASITNKRREIIFLWAQKEYRNLITMYENKIRVPKPIACEKHALVMEFIGDEEGNPAQQMLKVYPTNPKACFDEIVSFMKTLYSIDTVHGDLSEYNILMQNDKPVIIDVSQATSNKNMGFDDYLKRDCKNICHFFTKLGVDCDAESLYTQIKNVKTRKEKEEIFQKEERKKDIAKKDKK